MTSNTIFAEIAALAGDPARAGMLHALMDGRALTASELARVAGIAPQTASGGARGVGTLLELLGQPYAPTASPTAGYGGWTPHEPC